MVVVVVDVEDLDREGSNVDCWILYVRVSSHR